MFEAISYRKVIDFEVVVIARFHTVRVIDSFPITAHPELFLSLHNATSTDIKDYSVYSETDK